MLPQWYMNVKILPSLSLSCKTQVPQINRTGCISQIHALLRAFSLNHFITLGLRLHILERKKMQEHCFSRSCQLNISNVFNMICHQQFRT